MSKLVIPNELPRAKTRLPLAKGHEIILIDMLSRPGSPAEINQNVYRVNAEGAVQWQIETHAVLDERDPYTQISLDADGALRAICWAGVEYKIDLRSGKFLAPRS